MITILNRERIYIGYDMKEFAEVRAVLERNGIRYRYKLCTNTGSYGENFAFSTEYAVYVHKRDAEQARQLLGIGEIV